MSVEGTRRRTCFHHTHRCSALSLPFAAESRARVEARLRAFTPTYADEPWEELVGALIEALTPEPPEVSWARWYASHVVPKLADFGRTEPLVHEVHGPMGLLARAAENGIEAWISKPEVVLPPEDDAGALRAILWMAKYGTDRKVQDLAEHEVLVDRVLPSFFYVPPPVDPDAAVDDPLAAWRRVLTQRLARMEDLRSAHLLFDELVFPAALIHVCMEQGPPPPRPVAVRHGEYGRRHAERLRRMDDAELVRFRQSLGVAPFVGFGHAEQIQDRPLFGFCVDRDLVVLAPDRSDERIYLQRAAGRPITLLRSDPWNPDTLMSIDGSEPTFRGFAEWLSQAIVARELDDLVDDDDDEEFALSQWLLFHDRFRDEEVLDWRLEPGMVSHGSYIESTVLALSDEEVTLAIGEGREAYYGFLRDHVDLNFGA